MKQVVKKASFIASVCMAVLCCMSCGGSDDPVSPVTPPTTPDKPSAKVPISISTNITRATETAFESGDKVGLFVVNRNTDGSAASLNISGNYVDNMLYTYTNVWTPATEIYWKDEKTHADFYLYYPYRQQVESVTAMPFSTKANQSTEADYKAGDLLIGSTLDAAPSSEAVRSEAKHIMSRVDIRLQPGAGFTESTLAAANVKVSLNNIKTSATVDLATATATATGQASAITPYNDGSAYHAIIVPQQVAQCNLITVNVNGRDFNLPKAFTFQSGKRHTFTVTLDKTSSGVNVTIGAWENDGNDNGGSAI